MKNMFFLLATISNPSSMSVAVTLAVLSVTSLGAIVMKKFNK